MRLFLPRLVNHLHRQHQPGCSEHHLQSLTLASMLSLLDPHHRGGHGRYQTLRRVHRRPHGLRRRQWKIAQASLKADLEYPLHLLANARSPLLLHLQVAAPFLAVLLHPHLVRLVQQHLPSFPPKYLMRVHHLVFLPHRQLELRFLRLRRPHLVLYHPLLRLLPLLRLHRLQEDLLLLRQPQ